MGKSFKELKLAAEQGDIDSQYSLGIAYYNGEHDGEEMKRDPAEAAMWFRKAANKGDADAQCELAEMLWNGEGVDFNRREAMDWYHKAAEKGHIKAQYELGRAYEKGDGEMGVDVETNIKKAVEWYRKAAERGHDKAQFSLGKIYATADEEEVINYHEAYIWTYIAMESGYEAEDVPDTEEKIKELSLDFLKGELTANERREAEKEAKRRLAEIKKRGD